MKHIKFTVELEDHYQIFNMEDVNNELKMALKFSLSRYRVELFKIIQHLPDIPEDENKITECNICMDNDCYLDTHNCKHCKYNYICDKCFKTQINCPFCRTPYETK